VSGKWAHLAGVLTADKKLEVYVDGKLASSGKVTGLLSRDPAQAMEIGADEGGAVGEYGSPFGLRGTIDDVRLYYGEVTAEEITKHAADPSNTTTAGAKLVAHYTFDDGTAADASGNKNDGAVQGAEAVKGKSGGALRFKGVQKRRRPVTPFAVEHQWTQDVPLHVRAMVLAKGTLFIAGPPDVVDEEETAQVFGEKATQARLAEQAAAFAGEKGGLLRAVRPENGEKIVEYKLQTMPRWDGMAAANGRLYFSTVNGRVCCFGKQ
jgi:hypothetical protein